jgi:xanthine dehydrogenase accessory factor
MHETVSKIVEYLQKGEDLLLASVVARQGSAPRAVGAKMVLHQKNLLIGSVGGGVLEAQAIEKAQVLAGTKRGMITKISMTNQNAGEQGMICGGEVWVLLESLPATKENLAVYSSCLKSLNASDTGWLLTWSGHETSDRQQLSRTFISGEPPAAPSGGVEIPGLLEMINQAEKSGEPQFKRSPELTVWLEPVAPESSLYIFGGGHVGQAVSTLARQCGFKVVVIDDREEFANPLVHPGAHKTMVSRDYAESVRQAPINSKSLIAIMTRGHLHDYEVLAEALKSHAGYVGLMGSRKKSAAVIRRLKQDGFNQDSIRRIHTPIGLNIGAQTPAELAVSIVGELIAMRAGKQGLVADNTLHEK